MPRGQSLEAQRERFSRGLCPIHGAEMVETGYFYGFGDGRGCYAVGCSRRDCDVRATAPHSDTVLWALLPPVPAGVHPELVSLPPPKAFNTTALPNGRLDVPEDLETLATYLARVLNCRTLEAMLSALWQDSRGFSALLADAYCDIHPTEAASFFPRDPATGEPFLP